MLLRMGVEEQETSASRAQDLSSDRAMATRSRIPFVDLRVGDAACQALFERPSLVEQGAEFIEAILLERRSHFVGLLFHLSEHLPAGIVVDSVLLLFLEDAVRGTGHARV